MNTHSVLLGAQVESVDDYYYYCLGQASVLWTKACVVRASAQTGTIIKPQYTHKTEPKKEAVMLICHKFTTEHMTHL